MDSSRPINFGVFVPQGWRMDLVEIPDPVEKYETMTRVAQALMVQATTRAGSSTTSTLSPRRSWKRPSSAGRLRQAWPAIRSGSKSGRW
jgi:hypothetical protein